MGVSLKLVPYLAENAVNTSDNTETGFYVSLIFTAKSQLFAKEEGKSKEIKYFDNFQWIGVRRRAIKKEQETRVLLCILKYK